MADVGGSEPSSAGSAWLARLRHGADRAVEALAVILMLVMLAVVVLGVASRAINSPLVWTDELAQYLLVWLGFVGWIIATRRRNHIRITVFLDMLPDGAQRAGEILIQLAIVLFAAVLIWQAGPLIRRNIDVETVTLPFPSAVLYVLLPVLGFALIGQAVGEIAAVVRSTQAERNQGGSLPL